MRKLILGLGVVAIIVGAGFFWLLSQTGVDNAPQDTTTIDLTDRIEN
ncbi:MAG: hypothetical protein ACSHXY_04090 [Alphaproteobacteria bacterium]